MATQAGVPTVASAGVTPFDLWSIFAAAFANPAHTPIGFSQIKQGGVPTFNMAGVTPWFSGGPDAWDFNGPAPYAVGMRWFGFGWHYLFNTGVTLGNSGSPTPDNQPMDMFSVRGWTFDQPRQNTLIPQAPDSSTRFPSAS